MSIGIGIGLALRQAGVGATPWWMAAGVTPVAAYAAKGAADLASSYINLANPGTFNAAPGVAPTWDATNGWTFNGTTQYLTTGIVPATAWSMLIQYSNADAGSGKALAGGRTANLVNAFYILTDQAIGKMRFAHGNGTDESLASQAAGVAALAGGVAYFNGVSVATVAGAFGGAVPGIYIGANNNNGAANFFGSVKIQKFIIFNSALTSGNVAAVSASMV